MSQFLGCLFILIFGLFFVVWGILRMGFQMLFGSKGKSAWNMGSQSWQQPNQHPNNSGNTERPHTSYSSGNAHHEGSRANSRQRRSGKIFDKSEGEYVDFEEV
mgnify:CR=1 FL=1